MRERPRIQAIHSHRHAVGIRARDVEGSDPTHLAEIMLGSMGPERVQGEILAGGILQLEITLRDDEVDVSSHRTVRAVAVPRYDARCCLHFVAHSPTVATPLMLRRHAGDLIDGSLVLLHQIAKLHGLQSSGEIKLLESLNPLLV